MLIFLDIDGVMVPAKSWENPQLLEDGFYKFSEKAVRVLQNLVSEATTVVLTTSHKSRFTTEEWKSIFHTRGIEVNNLIKLDENLLNFSRKEEILNWIDKNVLSERFVILDDDKSLNSLPNFLKDNLVLTSSMVGLTDTHLDEINVKLENQLQIA
ncbi:MAG: HAD domain-containing protein [Crocinitomicaceae bacterium]|nr:HAD domain-containing protein [Crocinitomicaceae bacterium]